ncbi:hypothetical protein EVAR_14344_1 [Eumeta japonica]|uniref:Uncharacterized protein n=1 Tax=Eumeta variegata TaxID=151549 RepID=A0A4C1TX03_EUMVA|nr:hypothetical protein EVAR_14344_1 [Eumeta japonica]
MSRRSLGSIKKNRPYRRDVSAGRRPLSSQVCRLIYNVINSYRSTAARRPKTAAPVNFVTYRRRNADLPRAPLVIVRLGYLRVLIADQIEYYDVTLHKYVLL